MVLSDIHYFGLATATLLVSGYESDLSDHLLRGGDVMPTLMIEPNAEMAHVNFLTLRSKDHGTQKGVP